MFPFPSLGEGERRTLEKRIDIVSEFNFGRANIIPYRGKSAVTMILSGRILGWWRNIEAANGSSPLVNKGIFAASFTP